MLVSRDFCEADVDSSSRTVLLSHDLEGGMIRLETLIVLKFLNLSCSSFILLLELNKQLPIEQFEPTAFQSTVPSPPLTCGSMTRSPR